jgi:hypothetical protein
MDLIDLAPSLKRTLAAPGEFATFFPVTTDADLSSTLTDAVAEVQLDGFLSTSTLDAVNETVTPDLTAPQTALVVFYGMARVLTARVANLKNRTRYKAGPVEAEQEQAASVLVELLRETQGRKRQFLDDARAGRVGMAFTMVDLYVTKSIDFSSPDVAYITPTYLDGSFGSSSLGTGSG